MPKISEKIINLRDLQDQVHHMREQLTELGYQLGRVDSKYARGTDNFGVTMRYVSEFDRAAAAIDNTLNKALPRLINTLHEQRQIDNEMKHNVLKALLEKFFKRLDNMPPVTQAVMQGVLGELKDEVDRNQTTTADYLLKQIDPGPGKVPWAKWFKDHEALKDKTKTLQLFKWLSKHNWDAVDRAGAKGSDPIVPSRTALAISGENPKITIGIDNDANDLIIEVKGASIAEVKHLQEESHNSYDHLRFRSEQNEYYGDSADRLGPIEYWFANSKVEANTELRKIGGLRTKTIRALNAGHVWFPYQLLDRDGNYEPRFQHFKQPIHQIKGIGKRVILELQYALAKFGVKRHGLDLFTSPDTNRNVEIREQEALLTECLLTAGVEHFLNSDVDPDDDEKTLTNCLGEMIAKPIKDLVLPTYSLETCFDRIANEKVSKTAQLSRSLKLPMTMIRSLSNAWEHCSRLPMPILDYPTLYPDGDIDIDTTLDPMTIFQQLEQFTMTEMGANTEPQRELLLAEYFGWKSIFGLNKDGKTWYEDQFGSKPWVIYDGKPVPVNRLLGLGGNDPEWYKKPEASPF